MNNNTIFAVLAILVVASGVYYFFFTDTAPTSTDTDVNSAMRAEENMVVVNGQKPGPSVTGAIVYLATPGFLVVHEDTNGEPGKMLGSSAVLPTGESADVKVTLSRASRNGEQLHAMLHSDVNGDGKFDPTIDAPVESMLGGPISGWFEISVDAPDEVPVAI